MQKENPDFLQYLRELTVELSQHSRMLIKKNQIEKLHFVELTLNGTLFGRVIKLDSLPSSLSSLSKLETLRLEGFHFETLPEIINQLQSIKTLILSNNEIKDETSSLKLPSMLETLEFNGNKGFVKVPSYVWEFSNRKRSIQPYVEQGVLPSEAAVLILLEILRGTSTLGEKGQILKAGYVIETIGKFNLKKTRYKDFNWYPHKKMVYTLDEEGYVNRINSPYPKMPSIGIFPEQICNLTHLTELTLVRQKITRIPDCIENLEHLEVLDLEYNEIQNLPKSISKLKNLKNVYVGKLEIFDWKSVSLKIKINEFKEFIDLKTLTRLVQKDLNSKK
jgi:Leucine-rich repeat (LRR) protein